MTYVPYPVRLPRSTRWLGGLSRRSIPTYTTVSAQLKAGALRPLAVARDSASPGCRTCRPSLNSATPATKRKAGTRARPGEDAEDTLAQLVNWFRATGESPELKQKLAVLGISPNVVCGADYGAELRRQSDQYGPAIRAANIKTD